jgi:hypothetical protein
MLSCGRQNNTFILAWRLFFCQFFIAKDLWNPRSNRGFSNTKKEKP